MVHLLAVTKAALSLSDIDAVMQSIYEEGGKATRIMVSPKLRRDFSDLMITDTGVRRNIDEKGKLRQSVDVYMSDFGDLDGYPKLYHGLVYRLSVLTMLSLQTRWRWYMIHSGSAWAHYVLCRKYKLDNEVTPQSVCSWKSRPLCVRTH